MSFNSLNTFKLHNLSTVTRFSDIIGNGFVIKSIFEYSEREWASLVSNNEHLIKGIRTSGTKTDAIRTYIGKLVKLMMNAKGVNLSAWSKASMAEEHNLTEAVINRICVSTYRSNEELFMDVATHLMGFDRGLVEYALCQGDAVERAELLVAYIATHQDDVETALAAKEYLASLVQDLAGCDYETNRELICQGAVEAIVTREVIISGYEAIAIGISILSL